MAIFICGHFLFLICLLGELHDLAVRLLEYRKSAADCHVVGLRIERQVGTKDLRIGRLAHFQPLQTALGGIVHALCALKVILPVPLFSGMFLNEGDCISNFLRCIVLNIVICVAQRSCKLEYRNTVFKLHTLGDDAVAEKRSVAGGVALNGTASEDRCIVINGDAGLGLRHRADVARKAIFLRNINVMNCRTLIEKHRNIGRRNLSAEGDHRREAHHDRLHLVLVNEHDLLGEFRVVADAAVAAEELIQQLCNVFNNNVLLRMTDPQMFAAQPLRVAVDHHRHSQIVCHPTVAEHRLDIARLDQDDAEHIDPVIQPSGVIIKGIGNTTPFTAASVALSQPILLLDITVSPLESS